MLIGAHRGAYKDASLDENSISAFKKAIDFKVDYVEFDVHKTSDGKFIIHHDNFIKIDDQKIVLKETPWFGSLENYHLPITNEQLPLLDQVVNVCKGKIKMNVEIKDPAIGSEVVEYILSMGLHTTEFFISSFYESAIHSITSNYTNVYTGYLFIGNFWSVKKAQKAKDLSCKAINPYFRFLTKRILNYASKHNLEINTWTVNGKTLAKVMNKPQVTSIITNDVVLALEARDQLGLN